MTNINRTTLTLALATVSLTTVFAQSANRTMVGVPTTTQRSKIAIVETVEVRNCRLHCGSLAATPNQKRLPSAAEQQMRSDNCAKKMIGNR